MIRYCRLGVEHLATAAAEWRVHACRARAALRRRTATRPVSRIRRRCGNRRRPSRRSSSCRCLTICARAIAQRAPSQRAAPTLQWAHRMCETGMCTRNMCEGAVVARARTRELHLVSCDGPASRELLARRLHEAVSHICQRSCTRPFRRLAGCLEGEPRVEHVRARGTVVSSARGRAASLASAAGKAGGALGA